MAISKVILNGDTLMDVTSDTVEVEKLLSNETATKNDGTKVTGNIVSKSSTDLTVSGATVTAPAGYYSSAVSKVVATGSAFPPAVTITKAPTFSMNSSTGVITASYTGSSSITPTVNAGYISQGTAGTISTTGSSTYTLTTQGAQTITPGSIAQTIASNRWLTGTQTIAGDSNLKAENIAEGVPIFGVTGTHSGKAKHTATITAKGTYDMRSGIYCFVYVTVGQRHYTLGDTFEFSEGDTLKCCLAQYDSRSQVIIYVNGDVIYSDSGSSSSSYYSYDYILPDYDIDIALTTTGASMSITTPTISITENGNYDVADYEYANVNVTGEYYEIYKALANGYDIITTGSNSYTTQDVQDYCDSLSSIYNNQFVQRNFVPSGITFNNVTTIGSYAFGSVRINTTSGNYRGSLIYSFPSLLSINDGAFVSNKFIKEINAPNCSIIKQMAFYECDFLMTINFPACTSISPMVFYSCYSLSMANFPVCTSIGNAAFYSCRNLSTVNFPVCTSIGYSAFRNCSSLTVLSFPNCVSIGSSAFGGCSKLITIDCPNCSYIGSYAFTDCIALTSVNFSNCSYIGNNAFAFCHNLTAASFPLCSFIGSSAFSACLNLLSLYLLGSSVPTLTSYTAFRNTPIDGYTTSTGGVYGSIFVPASLYNDYITATNWSVYSERIVSV